MARIRTIKPEIWTDPEFTECSLSARLLLIALLNFATDHGVLPDKPKQLKMQCMPADPVDVAPLIEELIEREFIVRTTAPNGDRVLLIRTFAKNQKINRPSAGRWGDPAKWGKLTDDSVNPHGHISEPSPLDNSDTSDNSEGDDSDDSEASRRPSTGSTVVPIRPDDDDRMSQVIKLLADGLVAKFPPKASPKNHRNAIICDLRGKHGQTIAEFLAANPDHPAQLVADRFATEIA